ncbi:MAG: hypothetical protein J7L12_01240 [Desulfurococcales archaeon]|nr:hypothetical protein [Desulfurococcales archaeon]
MLLESYGARVLIESSKDLSEVASGLRDLFARRYIPSFTISERASSSYDARIRWDVTSGEFKVNEYSLGDTDEFRISSPPPKPYICESPYFFILQVFSRQYLKKGYLMLTDAVSFTDGRDNAYLILGYPHGGKSSILTIALAKGYVPLTTENTLVRINGDYLEVVGGTDVLVLDPYILDKYGLKLGVEPDGVTRHGYLIIDLSRRVSKSLLPVRIKSIYVVHCSFSSVGASKKLIKGRKAMKTLWHFATSIIRGTDYYDPYPLYLSDSKLDDMQRKNLESISSIYEGKFYEIFGAHTDVFNEIAK